MDKINETIEQKEGRIYSNKYNRFFKNNLEKSRYIESLYRKENDLRTEAEIAKEAGVYYDGNLKMFFETQQELLNYRQDKNFENWSEGNKYLYELFNTCSRNNIKTVASCGGHHDKQAVPYISIVLDEVSITYINNILEELKNMNNFWIRYHFSLPFEKEEWDPKNISKSIQIYGTNTNCCELFYRLNKAISQEPLQISKKSNEFVKKLNNLFFTPEKNLYKLVVESRGDINDTFGEKERILKEIEAGKHRELQQYYDESENTIKSEVLPADIVEADMDRKISQTKIEQIKSFFHRIIDFIKGNGAR